MVEVFDPYHEWLGIPPNEQPPNHYRLLGLSLGEADPHVIENAANRQLTHLRTVSSGPHAERAGQIENDISVARTCLLDSAEKQAYDGRLQFPRPAAAPPPLPPPLPVDDPSGQPLSAETPAIAPSNQNPKKRRKKKTTFEFVKIVVGGIAGLALGAVILWYGFKLDPLGIWPQAPEGRPGPAAANAPKKPEPSTQAAAAKEQANSTSPKENPFASSPVPETTRPASGPLPTDETAASQPRITAESGVPDTVRVDAVAADGLPPKADNDAQPQNAAAAGKNIQPNAAPPPVAAEDADTRLPVPEEAAQQESLRLVKELFERDFAKAATPAEKSEVAKRIMKLAEETQDNAVERYVLLRVAHDIAVAAGDSITTMLAIDKLDAGYQVDVLTMKEKALSKWSKMPMPKEKRSALAALISSTVEEAYQRDRYDKAISLLTLAQESARLASDTELAKEMATELGNARQRSQDHTRFGQALETLKANPDDPAANLLAGKYLCFTQANWDRGMPMLAKGGDANLKAAAQQDIKAGSDAKSQMETGDVWWDLGNGSGDEGRDLQALGRAAYWYEQALPGLEGLARVKVEKRLAATEGLALQAIPSSSPLGAKSGPSSIRALEPGLLVQTYERLPSQHGDNGYVHPSQLGKPIGSVTVVESLEHWTFDGSMNAVAFGLLKVDNPGEYLFKTYNFYDRNALFINGVLVCPYRGSTSTGTDPADIRNSKERILLKKGLHAITVVGYVDAKGSVDVKWLSPGKQALEPIPEGVLFHDASKMVLSEARPRSTRRENGEEPISTDRANPTRVVIGMDFHAGWSAQSVKDNIVYEMKSDRLVVLKDTLVRYQAYGDRGIDSYGSILYSVDGRQWYPVANWTRKDLEVGEGRDHWHEFLFSSVEGDIQTKQIYVKFVYERGSQSLRIRGTMWQHT